MEIRQFLALWKILAPAAGPFREEAAHGEGQDFGQFWHALVALYCQCDGCPGGLPSLWIKKSSHRFALRQGLAQGIDIYCILSGQPTTVQLNENSCWFHFFQHGYDKHFFWGWVDPTSCSCRMPLQFLPSLRLLQMMVQDEVNQVLGVLLGWHS